MVETNDTGTGANAVGASNAPGATPTPTDEPRILEEHVVTPPPKAVLPPVLTSLPTPTPSLPQNTSSPISKPLVPPVSAKPPVPLEKIESIDLSHPVTPPTVAKAPTQREPAQPVSTIDAQVNADIAHILEGVKLPERSSPAAPETPSQHTYDTSLTGTEPSDEKKARVREAARAVNESLPTNPQKSSDDVRPVHTLKEDLQNIVRTKKISMVRAVTLEEEKRHRPNILADEETVQTRQRGPFSMITLTILLFLLGAGALGGAYLVLQDRTAPTATSSNQLLFAEQAVPFPITGLAPGDIKRELASARSAGTFTLGSILQITPTDMASGDTETQTPVTLATLLSAIGAHPPEELSRALGSEFFFGFHAVDENAPVIVSTVTSYERAFAAMLEWEEAINGELAPVFTPVSMQKVGSDGVLTERRFEDSVIRNYDVRALKDDGGQIQLYYSFPTRNLLIIAESPYSFAELLSRLRADRRL